jgi:hypothetical protein
MRVETCENQRGMGHVREERGENKEDEVPR